MSILGILLMWIWLAAVFAIVNKWHMGAEYDRRQAYWEKYETK